VGYRWRLCVVTQAATYSEQKGRPCEDTGGGGWTTVDAGGGREAACDRGERAVMGREFVRLTNAASATLANHEPVAWRLAAGLLAVSATAQLGPIGPIQLSSPAQTHPQPPGPGRTGPGYEAGPFRLVPMIRASVFTCAGI
jgi:hypothetical protein